MVDRVANEGNDGTAECPVGIQAASASSRGGRSAEPTKQLPIVCPPQAVAEAKQLLGLCCTAAELMKSGQLFRAHQALARIRTEHFKEWDVSAEKARCSICSRIAHCHGIIAEFRCSACSCSRVFLV